MLDQFPRVSATLYPVTKSVTKGEVTLTRGTGSAIEIIEPQPLRANELLMLESGERNANWLVTWTTALVVTTDVISYGGRDFKAMQVSTRPEGEFRRVQMREEVGRVA